MALQPKLFSALLCEARNYTNFLFNVFSDSDVVWLLLATNFLISIVLMNQKCAS